MSKIEQATESFAGDMTKLLKSKVRVLVADALGEKPTQIKQRPPATAPATVVPVEPRGDKWCAVLPSGKMIIRSRQRDVKRVLKGLGL